MNWYKKSQLEFSVLKQEIEDANSESELISLLNKYNLDWQKIKLNDTEIIKIIFNGEQYIIDDFEFISLKDGSNWVWDVFHKGRMHYYLPNYDYSYNFWNEVGPHSIVYHATKEEYKDEIIKNGLKKMNKTRGIINKGTPSAIFASWNEDDISDYGNIIFAIHLGKMKEDGYMPEVSKESPVEELEQIQQLCHKIGIEECMTSDYGSYGIRDSTIIIYGNIPAKYLKVKN